MDTSGRISPRSSHLQAIPEGALAKWKIWSLDITNASSQSDGFGREVYPRAPEEWGPSNAHRIWESRAAGNGLDDAPVASHRSLRK